MGIVNEETPKKFGCSYIDEIRRNLKQVVLGDAMMLGSPSIRQIEVYIISSPFVFTGNYDCCGYCN